ncbi:MAG: helix-turn-helix transcriptional regulator [Deltaproteobacteria bacterium]|nr:helix-turn-helix transcriptional regulator [Deltaproteobacteria bacterium]
MGVAIGIAYINDIEHDRRNPPSPDFMAQLAAVLGVPPSRLISRRRWC